MKKMAIELNGYILSDVKNIPAGTSKATGKERGELYLFTILEQGATETTTLFADKTYASELQAVIDNLDYLAPVVVTGEKDGTKFTPTMIEPA